MSHIWSEIWLAHSPLSTGSWDQGTFYRFNVEPLYLATYSTNWRWRRQHILSVRLLVPPYIGPRINERALVNWSIATALRAAISITHSRSTKASSIETTQLKSSSHPGGESVRCVLGGGGGVPQGRSAGGYQQRITMKSSSHCGSRCPPQRTKNRVGITGKEKKCAWWM